MPGESDKKNWEKERRDRMRKAFSTLEKLLPSYDPSTVLTRINILNKSIEYIQDMQDGIEDLLKPSSKIITEIITNSSIASNPVVSTTIQDTESAVSGSCVELPTLGESNLILANYVLHPVLSQSQPIVSTQIICQVAHDSDTESIAQSIDNQKICGDEATTSSIVSKSDIYNATIVDDLMTVDSTNISKGIPIISNDFILQNEVHNNISSTDTFPAEDNISSKHFPIQTNKCVTKIANSGSISIPGQISDYPSSVFICDSTVVKKTIKARKKGNMPMDRIAFRKFKKITRKRKLNEKALTKQRKKEIFLNEVDKT